MISASCDAVKNVKPSPPAIIRLTTGSLLFRSIVAKRQASLIMPLLAISALMSLIISSAGSAPFARPMPTATVLGTKRRHIMPLGMSRRNGDTMMQSAKLPCDSSSPLLTIVTCAGSVSSM